MADEFTISFAIYDINVDTAYRTDCTPRVVREPDVERIEATRSDGMTNTHETRPGQQADGADTFDKSDSLKTMQQDVMDLDDQVPAANQAPRRRFAPKVKVGPIVIWWSLLIRMLLTLLLTLATRSR